MPPTVRIWTEHFPDGLVINESDFDAKQHRRFEDGPPSATPVAPAADNGKPGRKKAAPSADGDAQG